MAENTSTHEALQTPAGEDVPEMAENNGTHEALETPAKDMSEMADNNNKQEAMETPAEEDMSETEENDDTQEAMEVNEESDPEDGRWSPSSDASDSVSGSEVGTDQLEHCSDSEEPSGDENEREADAAAAVDAAEEVDPIAAEWTSRNGKITWRPRNDETLRYFPASKCLIPGLTRYAIARISDPVSSFMLLLTEKIMQHIVDMTNLHGRRTDPTWREIDIEELQAYVGLLILAGVYRSRNESTLSLWSEKSGRGIFRATMSHKRFHIISRTLCFDDKKSRARRGDDRLAAFRKVWDMWTHRLPMLFNPGRDICVDEQLVPFRGRCSFRQYMPKKPAKYGLKIWATCDVNTSYAWKLQVYTGKCAGKPEVNQGMRVVLEMTEGLKGYTITCDNFFTSFPLSEELLRRKQALVGTIRHNKPDLPPRLLRIRDRAVLSSVFAFTKNHTLVSYVQRRGKNVLLLSTKHRSPDISNDIKRKPVIIMDYNRCKGGVDNLDKCVGTYSCRRRTAQWPLALFHNVIDVSLYNSFILWISVNPSYHKKKPYKRRLFIEEVGEMLVTPHIKRRAHLPRSSVAAGIVANVQGPVVCPPVTPKYTGRRVCEFCPDRKRKTVKACCQCKKFSCRAHSQFICGPCST